MTVHDFRRSLAESNAQVDAPWWEPVYRRAFPGFAAMVSVRDDGWAQRGGIDRVVTLRSGKVISIDEKVRSRSYGDILLERWSSREHRTPGWVQKDLACDFIAYAFVPDHRCYLLPFLSLRMAWIRNGKRWVRLAEEERGGFSTVLAKNVGYTTESIAIPIDTLLSAIQDAQIVDWEATGRAA